MERQCRERAKKLCFFAPLFLFLNYLLKTDGEEKEKRAGA